MTGNVLGMEGELVAEGIKSCVYPPKDGVGFAITASTVPPTFDDALVVAVDAEVPIG